MPAAPPRGAGSPLLQDGFVLALTDSTPDGANAAWRAALVARDRGAPLHLLCVQPHAGGSTPPGDGVGDLARSIRRRLHVTTSAACAPGALRERFADWAGRAALLVLPCKRGNMLVDLLLGPQPERLFRSLRIPMLVVRRPALGSYRRVLVPVKLDAGAVALVAAARDLSRAPRMRVFHVLDTWQEAALRIANASERAVRLQRQQCSRRACEALDDIIRSAGVEESAVAEVSFGHVAARLLAVAHAGNAQLIVAGKERRPAFAEALCPAFTQRLLLESAADILVVPVSPANATPAAGAQGGR